MSVEVSRQREAIENTNCRLRSEEAQKLTVEERLEKAMHDLHEMKSEHITVSNSMGTHVSLAVKVTTLNYSYRSTWSDCHVRWLGMNAPNLRLPVQIPPSWLKHF